MKPSLQFVVAAIVITLSLLFFIYPSVIISMVILDSELRTTGQSVLVPHWFKSTTGRFHSWATDYLESQTAGSLHHNDVAATEWPIFGSVFFLVTAEDLLAGGWVDPTQGRLLEAMDKAAEIVASPITATWVRTKWGDTYLEQENVFYRMLLILGLSSYENSTGNTQYHEMMSRQRQSLARELTEAPLHLRDDYPDECYPTDVLWAVAAIQRAAQLDGTNHTQLARSLMTTFNGPIRAVEGLPAFQVDAKSGQILQNARGCGNSGILQFAAELDPPLASLWYHNYESQFWKDTGWMAGFSELPNGSDPTFMDVDSGPVLLGLGSVASAFGIGAAKTVGRIDHAAPLTMEAVACSWPTPFGFLVPGFLGKMAADSGCLGEVALLFSMTRPAYGVERVPFTGHAPGVVWILLFVYAGLGLFFIGTELRSGYHAILHVRSSFRQ